MHLVRQRSLRPPLTRLLAVVLAAVLAATLVPGVVVTASAAPGVPELFEQSGAHWMFGGGWISCSSPDLSGGGHAFSNTAGSEVAIAFVGTRFDLVAMTGPKFGIASVSVDGGPPVQVDLYSPGTLYQQAVYSTGDLPDALHVVRISCTGTANPAASDTYVGVDAAWITGIEVSMPVEQSDLRIARRGPWITYAAPGLSGGSHTLTNAAGAEVAVAFNGTRLDLVGMTGPKFGIASVSVDGGAPVDVDLHSADTALRQDVFSTGTLAAGAHVVRIVNSGRKNAASSDAFIGLDAALVDGTLAQAVIRFEETDPRLAWAGTLTASEAAGLSGGRYVWSGPGWGAVAVAFSGARFNLIATTGPQFGIASVSVDGGAPVDVDLYSPYLRYQQMVFTTGDIAPGQHSVVISWTGRANPAASGAYTSFDACEIGGDLLQATPPVQPAAAITFNYPWARYIVIDKSDLRLYYVENGIVTRTYPVAVGKASTPTPSATWRIDAKYYSSGVFGPRKMRLFRQSGDRFVYTAYNLHGTNNEASIGTYASHGCIRMYNRDVLEFFEVVQLGTIVVTRD